MSNKLKKFKINLHRNIHQFLETILITSNFCDGTSRMLISTVKHSTKLENLNKSEKLLEEGKRPASSMVMVDRGEIFERGNGHKMNAVRRR